MKVKENQVFLPKIGWVKLRKSRELEGTITQATVVLEGGYWYVSIVCEIEVAEPSLSADASIAGIDLGLEDFAIVADSKGIERAANPRFLRRELGHLRYLSRQLSRKVRGSQNRRKAKAKLQRFHARVRAKRKDYLHKLSTALVKSHDLIVVESLKVKHLLQNSSRALARSISDAGWRQFLQQLKYKCEHAGKVLHEAGEWFPSTQQCSQCGKKNKIALSNRWYSCSCGLRIHRDDNSALNLRAVGTTVLKACGAALTRGSNEAGILRL